MENYFTYKGIKYIVRFNNGKSEFFKSIDGQLTYLNENEKNEIEKLLVSENGYTYASEKVDKIIANNQRLTNKDYVTPFLAWLESIIPEECKENFYTNMQTIQINYNLDKILQTVNPNAEKGITGYNSLENSITMDPVNLQLMWEKYKSLPNGENLFWQEYAHDLLHELTHAASCNMNHQTMVVQTGFDTYPGEDSNRGLTEGFTEVIANTGQPALNAYESEYFIEESLVNLLIPLVGDKTMIRSFFGNKGTKDIEASLETIGYDNKKSGDLFRLIETNYKTRRLMERSNMLANIQNTLLDYLEAKLKKTEETREVQRLINIFEQFLLTEEKLSLNGKNPELFRGLKTNLLRFNNIKEVYINGKDPSILSFKFDEDGNPITNSENLTNQNVNDNSSLERLRQRIKEEYLNDIDDNVFISTEFEVNEARNEMRVVVKRKMSEDSENVVISEIIPYNPSMDQTFIKNCVFDFGECSPVMNHGVRPHQNTNGFGTSNSDLLSMAGNNNMISIKNISPETAEDLNQTLAMSKHSEYDGELDKKNNKELSLEEKPKQKVLKKEDKHNGFVNIGSMFMYLDLVLDIFFIAVIVMYLLQHK